MSQQYDLYNNNIKSVPNIYFLGTSDDNNYDTSDQIQSYINPNSIKNNCQTQASNQSSFLINSSNDTDENLMTRESNYNNFLWKYATNRLDDDTTVNLSSTKTTTYGEIQEGAKNQLEYLGCQVLKDSNKIYDQSGMSLFKIDQKTGAMWIALIIFVFLNFSFIAKSFFKKKSSFITLFSEISTKIKGNKIAIIGAIISALIISGALIGGAIPVSGNEENKKGTDFLLFNSFSVNITNNGYEIATMICVFICVVIIFFLFTFCYGEWTNKWAKYFALFLPLFGIALIYAVNYSENNSIAKNFTVTDSTTNTCKNISEKDTDNTRIVGYLFVFYLVSLILYIGLIGFNKNNTNFSGGKGFGAGFLYMFAIITPLLLLMFECTFALLQPILYFFVIILIRISIYLFSLFGKSKAPKLTAVLFNYPESYFDKMLDDRIKINYPTTLPSGASWNTVSILIFKIVFLIANKTSGGKIQASDFNFFNSLDA